MKTNTTKEFCALVRARIKKHVHDVAAVGCGALMGAVFLTFLGQNDARSPASLVQPSIVAQVSSEAQFETGETSSSLSSSETVPDTVSVSSESVSSAPVEAPKRPAVPKAIKKPTVVSSAPVLRPAADAEPESLSSASESSSASISLASSEVSSESPEPVSSASSQENRSSSSSQASSSASIEAVPAEPDFPVFDHASWPVGRAPNWGAMTTPAEWTRTYDKLTDADFVKIPRYDMGLLTTPMSGLRHPGDDATITAKLFYSTRYFGSYDLDAGEFTGSHAGIDFKLARGTPIGAIGGGRVVSATFTQMLGNHVIIEHRLKNGETYYSIYGHLDRASVSAGQDVKPGSTIGIVGSTGNSTAPHLHLQIDRGTAGENHVPFFTSAPMGAGDAARYVVNPIQFLGTYRSGD